MGQHAHRRVGEGRQHLVGAVLRAVVDHDHLDVEADVDGAHPPDGLGYRRPLVEHRHEHREEA